jgi:hypothetical protein
MIERNLGNIERLVRLLIGVAFCFWAFIQPQLNGVEWFVLMTSLALILNGIFSRCYLWYLFDVNTNRRASPSRTSNC